MPFTADELVNINNAALEHWIDKGKVWKQNVTNKPMLKAFNDRAGSFPGGKEVVSFAVKAGQGGGTLQGYTEDDQVAYYNPTGIKRARTPWKEHHMGMVITAYRTEDRRYRRDRRPYLGDVGPGRARSGQSAGRKE